MSLSSLSVKELKGRGDVKFYRQQQRTLKPQTKWAVEVGCVCEETHAAGTQRKWPSANPNAKSPVSSPGLAVLRSLRSLPPLI